ncbi:hypothetical protein HPB48_016118 [Haemaphysalis longicornis]|uniref:Mnd1 HTH domain-containing protein n=1 Tax=Haemaphysalis longicornis TaxID=44386 RepID=A0A9J6GTG0_HAELO|nr:hypothetical protein HPB48_016118 [Haemaphysalis longicornis]
MLQVFYEKKDVFQLKDLEKIGPKEKGVIAQAVKDVVQSLVDDGLVDSEKIGTSVYFWSFPSKAVSTRKRKLDELRAKVEDVEKKLRFVDGQLAKAQVGREESKDVFQLKDLEKIGPKEKGVIAQAVKDVVQSLVDDGTGRLGKDWHVSLLLVVSEQSS